MFWLGLGYVLEFEAINWNLFFILAKVKIEHFEGNGNMIQWWKN